LEGLLLSVLVGILKHEVSEGHSQTSRFLVLNNTLHSGSQNLLHASGRLALVIKLELNVLQEFEHLLLVDRELKSSEHHAGLKDGGRSLFSRCLLSLLALLLVTVLGLCVDNSNLRLDLSKVVEHSDIDLVNFSRRPSHFDEVGLRLRDSSALEHGRSHNSLPGVLAEVGADRVESNEYLLHVHHEDVGVGFLVLSD